MEDSEVELRIKVITPVGKHVIKTITTSAEVVTRIMNWQSETIQLATSEGMPELVDLLDLQVKSMDPRELATFRDELARRLPEVINQAAQAARESDKKTECVK